MADDGEEKGSEAPVVVLGVGQAPKLDGQVSNADDKSRTLQPCASVKYNKNKLHENRESKIKHIELEEERISDCDVEPSVLIRNVILENVALDETVTVASKPNCPDVSTGPVSSINEIINKMTPNHSSSSITDKVMELKTPEVAEMHSEWMISVAENAWNRKDYLDKVHLKVMNTSEMSLRGKELEKKTSIGPCALGSPSGNNNQRPSGISISIPRKSSKNFTETASEPIKPTGICLSKRSTSDLKSRTNLSNLQEREDMQPFTCFTHNPTTPSKCHIRKDDHVTAMGDFYMVPTTTSQAPPKGQFSEEQNINCCIKLRNRIGDFFGKIKSVLN